MNTNKKSRSDDRNIETARETVLGITVSTNHFSINKDSCQIQIADFLNYGQENAMHLRDLVQISGMQPRYIRYRIQTERLNGTPILSDNAHGYYLPSNDRERQQFVRSMRSRAREIEAVATAVEGADI